MHYQKDGEKNINITNKRIMCTRHSIRRLYSLATIFAYIYKHHVGFPIHFISAFMAMKEITAMTFDLFKQLDIISFMSFS